MLNPRVAALTKSATLKITSLTKKLIKEGKDVVNFAAGEPDFDTPDFIKAEAKKAIDEGATKYTPSAGMQELRDAISKKLREENGIPCEGKNVLVTSGAKYAIYAALLGLLDIGDEAIIPSPYWVSYPQMVTLIGAKPVFAVTKKEEHFKLTPEILKKSISPKTKALILNYPSNPTGITYSEKELKDIFDVIKGKNIFVISDEIYEKLIYDGLKHISFASLSGAADMTLTVNGFSKSSSMTGWRLGYLCAGDKIADEISKIIDHTTSCASSISQRAGLAALTNKEWMEKVRKEFESRRDLLYKGLSNHAKITPFKPQGTFYMFCDISRTGLSSFDFSNRLLEKYMVSVVPTDDFGAEGFVRLSFATSSADIHKGIERISGFLKTL